MTLFERALTRTQERGHRRRLLLIGLPLLMASWIALWTQNGSWNLLYFSGMWTGAILLMYGAGYGYPGLRRHLYLTALSVPLWWWFELVNARVNNWSYVDTGLELPAWVSLAVGSLAFSTVIPAVDAAKSFASKMWGLDSKPVPEAIRQSYVPQIALGFAMQGAIAVLPDLLFPLVWVAPCLIFDGLVGHFGGRSLVDDVRRGEWRLVGQLAVAGLICGFLWEFWNFWAITKWTYEIPYLDHFNLFEMPIAGYMGYIPFAWSVYQFVVFFAVRPSVVRPMVKRRLRLG